MSVSARGLFRIARGTPLRAMHTGGRQIPNNPTPSTSPHNPHDPHLHHQALTFPPENALHEAETTEIDSTRSTKTSPIKKAAAYSLPPTRHSPHPLATHTPKGKLIPTRPPALTTAPRSEEDKTSHMHPLWKFFRTPEEGPARYPLGGMGMTAEELQGLPSMTGEDAGMGMGSLEPLLENDRNLKSGRSWTTQELRLKSFKDLHTLWYLLLRERNVLVTQREERRRLGLSVDGELLTKRGFRCRKSMARIKYVLNERRLALIAAAESTRPAESIVKVHGTSPLGRADPMSLTGWEQGSQIPYSTTTLSESLQIGEEADVAGLSGGLGDGERQKMDLPESGETEDVVKGESVSQEEIEAKDEGFGGGKEAKDFVKNTQI